eukprot:g2021.t1
MTTKTDVSARAYVQPDPGYFLVDPKDEDANFIASTIPGFDFKGVPSFFDVGGICANPKALRLCTQIFAERCRNLGGVDSICGLDARGFIFGPLVAQELGVPFFMMRKKGKLPGPVMECAYETEYSKEVLTISCSSVKPGDRVVIFDDLIATGGTTIAAANLIVQCGGVVAEVQVITAIAFFKGWKKFRNSLPQLKNVPIFAIVEATNTLAMPSGSTDSYTVKSGSTEHRCMVEAMKSAKLGDVICKETTQKGSAMEVRYSVKPKGPGKNTKYAESEGA